MKTNVYTITYSDKDNITRREDFSSYSEFISHLSEYIVLDYRCLKWYINGVK